MKHSDINRDESAFGLNLNNKRFNLVDQMSINNSINNSIMIDSSISQRIHHVNSSTILSTALNQSRSNVALLSRPNVTSPSSLMTQFTYNNNAIKLVNLSKYQQQLSINNKDNSNILTNNGVNVQFVTPIINNNTPNLMNDLTISKIDATPSINNNNNVVLANSANLTMTANTRFILHTSQASSLLPHGSLTIIPQQSTAIPSVSSSIITSVSGPSVVNNNNQLIKNTRFPLTVKQTPQPIRPLTACSTSIISQITLGKQSTNSKIPPSKPSISSNITNNNYTINITHEDQQQYRAAVQSTIKNTNIKPINCTITSSNNIRLALTSSNSSTSNSTNHLIVNHPQHNTAGAKIQLISPKSTTTATRKRPTSPTINISIVQDGNMKKKDSSLKDENVENPTCYNSQSGSYSPARKRARKQHLKSVNNNKLQKIVTNTNKFEMNPISNNIRQILTDKPVVSIAPITTKFTNFNTTITTATTMITTTTPTTPTIITTSQNNKQPSDNNNSTTSIININPQIIIPLKNSIHICSSKTATHSNLYTNNLSANNNVLHNSNNNNNNITNNNNNNSNIGNFNQVQIITQGSQPPRSQLSPSNQSLILSPKFGKHLSSFSPQKVIHLAPTKMIVNSTQVQTVKNEKMIGQDLLNRNNNNYNNDNKVEEERCVKLEVSDIKFELSHDFGVKYSLFPYKYNWNARRTHFEKECDVKIKKSKPSSSFKQLSSEDQQVKLSQSECEIQDTSWRLFKACNQFLMQKSFDEENLRNFHKLKEKIFIKPQKQKRENDSDVPIFEEVCLKQQHFYNLPDIIDGNLFMEYTDPKLFGISEDINENHINVITEEKTVNSQSHDKLSDNCTDSCLFYVSEVPAVTQPPKILRILDLIEGLIVKEKKIIEKESEIHDQCLRLLQTSECPPLGFRNQPDRIKILNGRRW